MSRNVVMALILSGGIATWIYVKMMKSTSQEQKVTILVSAISFGICFLVIITVLQMLPDWWNK